MFPQNLLDVFKLPPFYMLMPIQNFLANYFICYPIFKLFATLFMTFGLQQDDMVIFFLWCFRK